MTKHHPHRKSKKQYVFWILLTLVISTLAVTTFFYIIFSGRIYPNVFIGNFSVGGLTFTEAEARISHRFQGNLSGSLILKSNTDSLEVPLSQIEANIDLPYAVQAAYATGRNQRTYLNIQTLFKLVTTPYTVTPRVTLNDERLNDYLSTLESQVNNEAIPYSVKLVEGEITVTRGAQGIVVDRDALATQITTQILENSTDIIHVPTKVIDGTLAESEVQELSDRSKKLIGKVLTISYERTALKKSAQDLVQLLAPTGYRNDKTSELSDEIAKLVKRDPQNPIFNIQDGKVLAFAPPLDGLELKEDDFLREVENALTALITTESQDITIEVPLTRVKPAVASGEAMSYGITELIGRGTSTFRGSIPSRVFNVGHASAKINGALIAPGDTFSFNARVGDISQLSGFKQAYVIQDGRTILGDGGGVCQVSTTLFRAVMNAGLPIVERRAHSYRVGYYEQDSSAGLDATIFSPTTDFKFKNDTGRYVLIHTIPDLKNYRLTFELYGTRDGRVATISKPIISNVSPPPEDSYIDDPTLPLGQVKQVENKAWGARSTFTYLVTKDGQPLFEKTFVSNYRPWQAIFMRGTGPTQ